MYRYILKIPPPIKSEIRQQNQQTHKVVCHNV